MNDLIFTEGDLGVDEDGFVHGPLRRRQDRLGLFAAANLAWDFHGAPLDTIHPRLVEKYPPRSTIPPAIASGEIVAPHFPREFAQEAVDSLHRVESWIEGFRAGSGPGIPDDCLPPIRGMQIIVHHIESELRKTEA